MELFKTTNYYFNPYTIWSLDNCTLPKGTAQHDYHKLMADDNYQLEPERQQYYWFDYSPNSFRDEIVSKKFCTVTFNVYLGPSNLISTVEQDDKHYILDKIGYMLFVGIYHNKRYEDLLAEYSDTGIEDIELHYIWWLYCLSGAERKFLESEYHNNRKICVFEIVVTDGCN